MMPLKRMRLRSLHAKPPRRSRAPREQTAVRITLGILIATPALRLI